MLLVSDINLGDLINSAGWSSYDFYAVFALANE
jgi:hypothetical protein